MTGNRERIILQTIKEQNTKLQLASEQGRRKVKTIEIKELRIGELVKVDHDWYVYGIAEVNGEVDDDTGETETIQCHALYTINEWLSECGG